MTSSQEYAVRRIMSLARRASQAVTAVRVSFSDTLEGVVLEAKLEAGGKPVRVEVAAQTAREAVDLAQDRLHRKLSQLGRCRAAGADQAIFEMELLDYDFRLFTDTLSGVDSVVYRDGSHRYHISRLDGNAAPVSTSVPVLVDAGRAPCLTLGEAADALNAKGLAFLFFANPDSRRGNVLYRRLDGHYTLVTP